MTRQMIYRLSSWLVICVMISLIAACATQQVKDGAPRYHIDVNKIPNAKPRPLPKSRYGNPAYYDVYGKRYHVLKSADGYRKRGIASWYGTKFQGRLTSSREPYSLWGMTAASPVLPIPSFVKVTNLKNGRWVIVKVNDRGPFAANRIIDLSYAAAKKLGYVNTGTALVEVAAINPNVPLSRQKPLLATKLPRHPKLYLQLGAFRSLANAENLKQKVQNLTHKRVVIAKGTFQSLPIYRVRVGPLIGVGESDRLLTELHHYGLKRAVTTIS